MTHLPRPEVEGHLSAAVRVGIKVTVMVAAAIFIYAPVLHGDWLWDDLAEIPNNTDLRNPLGLLHLWFAPGSPDYYPLKATLQWVEWHLWGDARLGYHLVNLALHVLGAVLLWRLLRQLGIRAAYLGGLIFLVHPLAVESVAWLSELKNVLSLPFLLLAFSRYLDFERNRSAAAPGTGLDRDYLFSLAYFLAGLLCKSSVVVLPALLLLHAAWRRGRIGRADGRALAPFIGLALGFGLITVWFQSHRAFVGWQLYQGGLWSRLAGGGLAVQFYLAKLLWPRVLLPVYPRWSIDPPSPVQFLPWLVLAAVLLWLWTGRRRASLFGMGWFVAALAPVMGFVPMSFLHIAPVADHLAYLPMAGLILGLVAAGERFGPALALGGGFLCLALAVESRRYAAKFIDQETLWAYALPHNPRSPALHDNFAFVLRHDRRFDESIAHYREAARLAPADGYLEYELAETLVDGGRRSEAVDHYRRALALAPSHPEAYDRLADSLAKLGRSAEAIENYRESLRLRPGSADVENSLGVALADSGRLEEAIGHYRTALRLHPEFAHAANNLGLALAKQARWNEAILNFKRALEIEPGLAGAHENLGYAHDAVHQPAEAVAEFGEAVRLQPDSVEYQNNFGFALARAGRLNEAIGRFEQALRLKPDDAAAEFNLGAALQAAGRKSEARPHFARALQLNPNFTLARERLQQL